MRARAEAIRISVVNKVLTNHRASIGAVHCLALLQPQRANQQKEHHQRNWKHKPISVIRAPPSQAR